MRLLTALSTALVTIGLATAASAADLPRAVHKAPAYVPPAAYNWTGLYLGLNGGYGWADSGFGDADGFVGGGQIGYNWQAIGSPWVFGLEADIQGTDMDASQTAAGITATGKVNGFGTIRGRIGYAWDRAMLYGTGGVAFTRTELSVTNGVTTLSDKDWSTGWTLGAGLEYAFWNRWSAKLEYLYVDAGDTTLTLAGIPVTGDYNFSVVRAGLNYRF
jgi:outer membrane immunogenic protein